MTLSTSMLQYIIFALFLRSAQSSNLFLRKPRIIGGIEASSSRYPYTVALTSGGVNFFCGGTLIAPDIVLTAAHCLDGGGYNVAIGRHDLTSTDGEEIHVEKEIRHPNYSTSTDENDFALLKLSQSVSAVSADDLVRINSDEAFPAPGDMARTMGWGDTDQNDEKTKTSDILLEVDITVISNEECKAAKGSDNGYSDSYKNYIFDSMLCTFLPGQDACQGDSGGPLIIPGSDSSSDILIGVTSWGIGCATKVFPGVFARVSHAYVWIAETTCSESVNAPAYLCETSDFISKQTEDPSTEPMPEPTKQATAAPTLTPSEPPTELPTTLSPTLSPSKNPIDSPTLSPSLEPTSFLSISSVPSASPTSYPTISIMPIAPSTSSPTHLSSLVPSRISSNLPSSSLAPSVSPTEALMKLPTTSPAPTSKLFLPSEGNPLLIPISASISAEKDGTKNLNEDRNTLMHGNDYVMSAGVQQGRLMTGVILSGFLSMFIML